MDAAAQAIVETDVISAATPISIGTAAGPAVPRRQLLEHISEHQHQTRSTRTSDSLGISGPMVRQLRHPSIIDHLPLQWMPTPAAITTITIVRAGEVVLEVVAAETQDAMAAEARSPLTKVSMVQEKVQSVSLTLLLICHATAASLILTAHTDSALFRCDHPPLTSPR